MAYRIFLIFFTVLGLTAASAATYYPHRDVIAGPVMGEVTRVLDGDTVAVKVHVWIGEDIETHVRIAGIDAPELHGKCDSERRRAIFAKDDLEKLVAGGKVTLTDIKLEKYAGRVMAKVQNEDGTDVGSHMLQAGLARPYHGEKRKTWCGA